MKELQELYRIFLEDTCQDTFDAFVEAAKLHYGESTYKACVEFFLVFGGADLCDYLS